MFKMFPKQLLIFTATISTYFYGMSCIDCNCSNPQWCESLKTPLPEKEVYIFMVSNENWKLYDWNKITTVAVFTTIEPEFLCFAHSKGVRVVPKGNFPVGNLTNERDRHKWVKQQIDLIQQNNYDGINVDFEAAIPKENQTVRDGLSLLMWELYSSLKSINPHYQVVFDIGWRPNQDQRFYDYAALATNYTDFAFVMSYDERSQIYESCTAWANSAINNTIHGIQQFLKDVIPASKLVLGVPWYGYNYPCTKLTGSTCFLKEVPFRGAPCSDAAGSQVGYGSILKDYKPLAVGGVQFDDISKTPFFTFKDKSTGQMHQMWFDDPKSLKYKYDYALSLDMRGVGMWEADQLDYSNSTEAKEARDAMWGALPDYRRK